MSPEKNITSIFRVARPPLLLFLRLGHGTQDLLTQGYRSRGKIGVSCTTIDESLKQPAHFIALWVRAVPRQRVYDCIFNEVKYAF